MRSCPHCGCTCGCRPFLLLRRSIDQECTVSHCGGSFITPRRTQFGSRARRTEYRSPEPIVRVHVG